MQSTNQHKGEGGEKHRLWADCLRQENKQKSVSHLPALDSLRQEGLSPGQQGQALSQTDKTAKISVNVNNIRLGNGSVG